MILLHHKLVQVLPSHGVLTNAPTYTQNYNRDSAPCPNGGQCKEERKEGEKEKGMMMERRGQWGTGAGQERKGVREVCNIDKIGPNHDVHVHWLGVHVVAVDDNVAIDILLFVQRRGQLVLVRLLHQLLLFRALFTVEGSISMNVWERGKREEGRGKREE